MLLIDMKQYVQCSKIKQNMNGFQNTKMFSVDKQEKAVKEAVFGIPGGQGQACWVIAKFTAALDTTQPKYSNFKISV